MIEMNKEQTLNIAAELLEIVDEMEGRNELMKLVPEATKNLRNGSVESAFDVSMILINDLMQGNQNVVSKINEIIHLLHEVN